MKRSSRGRIGVLNATLTSAPKEYIPVLILYGGPDLYTRTERIILQRNQSSFTTTSHQNQTMDNGDQERKKQDADAAKELVRLWRTWRTVHQMCLDRVCEPPQPSTDDHRSTH